MRSLLLAAAGRDAGHVSAYATMHPWEDRAETFAHYLHLRDMLQTAGSYGLRASATSPGRLETKITHLEHHDPGTAISPIRPPPPRLPTTRSPSTRRRRAQDGRAR